MNEPIKLQISEYGDIPGAISRLEESTAGCPDVCILICEELLDHLLKSGYRVSFSLDFFCIRTFSAANCSASHDYFRHLASS